MRPRIAIPHPHSQKPDYNQRALPQYLCAIEMSGGEPVPVDLALSNAEITKLAMTCDGVLLPGSPADVDPEKYGAALDPRTAVADPQRDNADELLLQDAYNMRKPVLGICYGVQTLNVWRTGTLIQHVDNHSQGRAVQRAHMVQLEPDSLLGNILSPAWEAEEGWVNSSHHQAIENVGDGLRVVARSDDGVIEAVESTESRSLCSRHPVASRAHFRRGTFVARNLRAFPGGGASAASTAAYASSRFRIGSPLIQPNEFVKHN